MRKRALAAGLCLATLLLAGCDMSVIAPRTSNSIDNAETAQEVPTEVATEAVAADDGATQDVPAAEPQEEFADDEQVFTSPLSGERIGYNKLDHRPLAVMLNNIKAGCPQSGIEEATVVYEAPVEGRITRLMGIFENYEDIPKIGSIRSCRDYYVYLALEYDCIYTHFGQATIYVGDLLNSNAVDNISGAVSGINDPALNAFFRTTDRKAPHNVYVSNEGIMKDIDRYGYRKTLRSGYQQKFTFADYDKRVTYDDKPDATILYPGGKTSDKANGFSRVESRFEYNADDGKYYRYQYGDKHIDLETGNQLTYDNVIFQYCDGMVRDSNDYLAFGLIGDNEQKCKVFTGGKEIDGTWSRTEIYGPTIYNDENGNPITINPGKTWICIIWNDYADDVVIE